MDNMIYAEKGTMKTVFSQMVWKNMGANKNGWKQISKEQYDGTAPTGSDAGGEPSALQDEQKYRTLYEQGKGFEQDGKYASALQRYQAAYDIKASPSLKGKINKMAKALEDAKQDESRNELIETAKAALLENDFETAIEAYESAQEIRETKDIAEAIAEAQKKQDEAMVG